MPIYSGSDKIKEIYNGSQSIGYVYNGSQLVWQHNPYPIGTVLANTQTEGSVLLYPGQYEMKVSGAGGNGYHVNIYWGEHASSGGSGACWEGVIKITSTVTISWTTGTGVGASVTVSIGGTNVLTAGGGGNASGTVGGTGGALTTKSAFNSYIVSTSKASNGTQGAGTSSAWGRTYTDSTAAPSTMGWGIGADCDSTKRTNGGFYLKRTA